MDFQKFSHKAHPDFLALIKIQPKNILSLFSPFQFFLLMASFQKSLYIILSSMKPNTKKSFHHIMKLFIDESKAKKMFKKSEGLYLMRSFKIENIFAEQAIQSYNRISNKYDSGELKVNNSDWHKNERKLFIEYLICYCEQNKISIQDLSDQQWSNMEQIFWNKNPLFLKFQGLNILKNTKRHNWSNEDDSLLKKFVIQIGSNQWNAISKSIFFHKNAGRFISPKQCRQRWFNHICSQINKNQWSNEEDIKILKYSLETGKKWSAIARMLNTHRTEHMVKNRYNSIINKIRKKKMESQESLIRKALQSMEKENSEEKEMLEEQSKSMKIKISAAKEESQKQQSPKKENSRLTRLRSTEGEQEYNYSELKDGELKDLNQIVNRRDRGIITFSNEDGCGNIGEGGIDSLTFSMTPNSVKAISPAPSFTGQLFRTFESYLCNEKKREDGTSLFSPACFSPVGYPSFSPGTYQLFALKERGKQQKNPSTVSNSRSLQYPSIHSDLSRQYSQLMNNKRQHQQ